MNAHDSGDHRGPDLDDATVEALGALSEALETTHRARGQLYTFHQLTGSADLQLGRAVELLRAAGHGAVADRLEHELVGRNVIPDHWTFQLVEEYDDTYWEPFVRAEREVREQLADGARHSHEARMKAARRTHGHSDHTAGR
ncbi:hypothetical protein POF50_006685 [Streptomyces sp. SL13]|uniref:Uncharacterized protein n=1 Tax=Streptantibioticus silvisoli TaxID=2705255 RepID=A0AA90H193_9ACTN|nr:hypothetical protein [Streptantibioticus silvisoli]MDI5969034.1 hypothetical protein [Streptantibioticus silvisoli]